MKQHPKREATHKITSSNPTAAHTDSQSTDQAHSMGLERLVFFSDAVFAIAITLLALEIRLPDETERASNSELLAQLLALGPKYLGYVISFLVIGSFWMGHHSKFRIIKRYDDRLLFLNLLQLMVVAFVPFPTSVLSENGNRTATIFYALIMVVAGLLSTLTWWYAVHGNRLVDPEITAAQRRQGFVRNLVVPAVFLLSIGIAFINEDAAKFSWLLLIPASMYIR